jgi:hypothetical protein
VETVLVLRALGLGDLLTAVPALRAVRRARPAARLVLAAPAGLRELALLTGAVDELVPVGPLEPLPPSVAGADLAVNLHGRGPQSTALLAATAPRRLLSYGLPGGPQWRADEHEVQRWCRLLEDSGLPGRPVRPRARSAGRPALVQGRHARAPRRGAGVPALAGGPVGRVAAAWPRARRPGDRRAAERELAEQVAAAPASAGPGAGRAHDLLGLTSLVAAGPAAGQRGHRRGAPATALGPPSVVLFGPHTPALWGRRRSAGSTGVVGGARGQLRGPAGPRPAGAQRAQVLAAALAAPGRPGRGAGRAPPAARRGGLPSAMCATLCATLDATAPLPSPT